jgi:hypothetical protein
MSDGEVFQAEQVLTADYEMTDKPLNVGEIPGVKDAVGRIQNQESGREFVRCEERVMNYDVYWNEKTDSVRIAAVAMLASYEVDHAE